MEFQKFIYDELKIQEYTSKLPSTHDKAIYYQYLLIELERDIESFTDMINKLSNIKITFFWVALIDFIQKESQTERHIVKEWIKNNSDFHILDELHPLYDYMTDYIELNYFKNHSEYKPTLDNFELFFRRLHPNIEDGDNGNDLFPIGHWLENNFEILISGIAKQIEKSESLFEIDEEIERCLIEYFIHVT